MSNEVFHECRVAGRKFTSEQWGEYCRETRIDGAEYHSSMDMWNDLATMTEAQIMGECTRMVMESDLVVLDDGWECSRGCTVERYIALQYDVPVRTLARLKLDDVLTGVCKLAERNAV